MLTHLMTQEHTPEVTTLSRCLAPEDLRAGQHVAVLERTCEVPPFFYSGCDPSLLPPDEPVRLRLKSAGEVVPMEIKSVCLPFVLLERDKKIVTLDVRLTSLALLSEEFVAAYRKLKKAVKKSTPACSD